MALLPLVTIAAGLMAAIASMQAYRAATELKRAEGQSAWALRVFWATVTAYMAIFTLLRVAHFLDWGLLVPLFYVQTLAGAFTLISLLYILFGILIGLESARWASEAGAMIAFVTLFLIFFFGVEPPYEGDWGVELLPVSVAARSAVGLFYVVAPVALGVVVFSAARKHRLESRRRIQMFAVAVALMYVPNAIRYVLVASGPSGAILAWVMAIGALIGWRSYR